MCYRDGMSATKRKRRPKKGDKVRVKVPVSGRAPDHVYTVDQNRVGLPAPYYLDDGDDENPFHTGPFRAHELEVVE